MKKILILSIFVCLSAISAFAQEVVNTKDFSGDWELDVSKSKLDERARIESMTMKVAQTNNDIKIETNVKRSAANSDGGGMNRGGGGMMGGGNSNLTYTLDGKETKITQESPMGAIPVSLKAKFDGDKLKLNQTRTMNTQMGEVSIITKETWTLSADGKTLTVKREMETPRGTNSSEMVFTKIIYAKVLGNLSDSNDNQVRGNTILTRDISSTSVLRKDPNQTVERGEAISGGVLNAKAKNLVTPKYPEPARKTRASGAVTVAVTVDEEGNIISADAVSGHPLLRGAAVEAAKASKFYPYLLEGVPVKVTGVIVYNFVP